jgi:hypothetical protein
MPIVHCPSCQRALHLPEAHPGGEARCPLCQSMFPTPAAEAPILSTPLAEPTFEEMLESRPFGVLPEEAAEESPSPARKRQPSPDVIEALPRDTREALQAAVRDLKRFVVLGTVYLLTCGCVDAYLIGEISAKMTGLDRATIFTIGLLLLRLLVLGVVFLGAAAMQRCQARGLALTAAVLALVFAVAGLLCQLPVGLYWAVWLEAEWWAARSFGDVFVSLLPGVVSLLLALVAAVLGIRGGVHALYLLHKPEVLRAYRGEY